jgi:hypothetical protein
MLLSRDFFSKTAHHTLYKISTTRLIEDLCVFIHGKHANGSGIDGKIIMCFYEEILEMGISIEVSFSAQQCCGGLPSKQ